MSSAVRAMGGVTKGGGNGWEGRSTPPRSGEELAAQQMVDQLPQGAEGGEAHGPLLRRHRGVVLVRFDAERLAERYGMAHRTRRIAREVFCKVAEHLDFEAYLRLPATPPNEKVRRCAIRLFGSTKRC